MAAVGVEEDPTVQAARILLSLRHRTLLRPPEWAPLSHPTVQAARILLSLRHRTLLRPPEWAPLSPCEAPEPVDVPEGWPKRRRSGRERLPGDWRAALAELKLGHPAFFAGSGSWSSGEDGERLPPRARERPRPRPAAGDAPMAAPSRRPGTPVYYVSPAGSGPSTSAADRAAPRPRHTGEEAAQQASKSPAAAPVKEPMSASSPETPLDFSAAAAGSNASSSGDDAARPPPKRKSAGSGGASCGDDEGCSSPAKRPRVADAGGKAAEEKAISAEPKTQSERSTNGGDEGVVKFKFDLNIPWPDECPDMY